MNVNSEGLNLLEDEEEKSRERKRWMNCNCKKEFDLCDM